MSKSILIVDTPENCNECPFFNSYYFGEHCGATEEKIKYDYDTFQYTKSDWCPLLSLPERKDLTIYTAGHTGLDNVIKHAHDQGYNDCLDEIKGASL